MNYRAQNFLLTHKIIPYLLGVFIMWGKGANAAQPICYSSGTSNAAVCTFLLDKYSQGLAAGNAGDAYDNHDKRHVYLSNIPNDHPQIIEIGIPDDAHDGFKGDLELGKVSIGQTSQVSCNDGGYGTHPGCPATAYGSHCTSMPLQYYFLWRDEAFGYNQYQNNNAYWYPEHLDDDALDNFLAMAPFANVSQGSSGSELDEVKKSFWALAAFKPAVKAKLKEKNLLIPTLQMIFRRTHVATDADYLTYKAHPTAFDDYNNYLPMVQMANGIELGDIPPMVQIKVLADDYQGVFARDFFEYGREVLFDTPVSVARIFRGQAYTKKMTVSAAQSYDINNRPLTYHWAVLRGDPAHVHITPRTANSSEVDIEFDYHTQLTVPGKGNKSNLVIVGVFVNNGQYYSAPAFITSFSLNNEVRAYDTAAKRLTRIDYNTNYVNNNISCAKAWSSDTFNYAPDGRLLGWTRVKDGTSTDFTVEGYQVIEKNASGRPIRVQRVTYQRYFDSVLGNDRISWVPTGSVFNYQDDIIPPTVSILTPNDQDVVSGEVTVEVSATDQNQMTQVEISIDGIRVGSLSQVPYLFKFDSSLLQPGRHELEAKATDLAGNVGTTKIEFYTQSAEVDPGVVIRAINAFYPTKGQLAIFDLDIIQPTHVQGTMYSRTGEVICEVANEERSPGPFSVKWNGRNNSSELVAAGVYILNLKIGSSDKNKKVVVLK